MYGTGEIFFIFSIKKYATLLFNENKVAYLNYGIFIRVKDGTRTHDFRNHNPTF